jgi:PTH1 family peptidyl-tRNA hydrolase
MTFMNRSGASVAPLARFFKIEPQDILVVHDELDLLPGQVKLKFGGSPAGHNGLKDIQGLLGTADFWRLRLGIGHPGVRAEVANYVLKKPSAEQRDAIDLASSRALKAIDQFLQGEMDAALTTVHAQPPRPKPPRPAPPAPPAPAAFAGSTPAGTPPPCSTAAGSGLGSPEA